MISMENIKHHGAEWCVYLSVLSGQVKFGKHTIAKNDYIFCVMLVGEDKIVPIHNFKAYCGDRNAISTLDVREQAPCNSDQRDIGSCGLQHKHR